MSGISTSITKQFSARVEGFLLASGMAPSRLGRDAVGDPNLVKDMREGRSFHTGTMDTVLEFIARWEREHKKLRVA